MRKHESFGMRFTTHTLKTSLGAVLKAFIHTKDSSLIAKLDGRFMRRWLADAAWSEVRVAFSAAIEEGDFRLATRLAAYYPEAEQVDPIMHGRWKSERQRTTIAIVNTVIEAIRRVEAGEITLPEHLGIQKTKDGNIARSDRARLGPSIRVKSDGEDYRMVQSALGVLKSLIIVSVLGLGTNVYGLEADDHCERATATAFFTALKAGDKQRVAEFLKFPVGRDQPLDALQNIEQFKEHYEEFFDAKTIAEIEEGMKDIWCNWRGTAIGAGLVWIEAGKVRDLIVSTELQKKLAKEAKNKEAQSLHPSVREYDWYFVCKTATHSMRIHGLRDGGEQLISWKRGDSYKSKPIFILKGESRKDGTGAPIIHTFHDNDFTYEIWEPDICTGGEDCKDYLHISRGGKNILSEPCL